METLEVKSASRRARLWARLSDPDKRPRIWWFPPSSRRDEVLRMPEAARQEYQKVVQQVHEKFSETVRLAMLSLLGFALFCLLITFSAPDSTLLVADPTIKMPFADVQVSFQSFLILAPFLLIVVTLYLHMFYGYWLDLETDHQHLTHSREVGEPLMEHLPTLFSLDHPVPRLLTAFIFYWLVPLVLVTITWKAAVSLIWGLPLMFITNLVTAILVFLQIRRSPASQRQRNRWRWLVMVLIVSWFPVVITFTPQWFERRWNIYRADLKGKSLAGADLYYAYAELANFQGANLDDANLRGADLRGATLRGATLQGAWLRGANLQGATLQNADLRGAKLQHAQLQCVKLHVARQRIAGFLSGMPPEKLQCTNLIAADLGDADLRGATLQGANL